MSGVKLRGCGHCVPARVVTNDDLARRMDTSDAWISSRTGIRSRHICGKETQAQLCTEAARMALERAGVRPEEIGVCLVATMTPESLMPSTACALQKALGLAQDTVCFDMNAACTGFVYALHTAECLLAASPRRFALVVGGDAMSRIVDWSDRSTCILFGDGAGAAVVEYRPEWPSVGAVLGCDVDSELLYAAGPGSGKTPRIAMEGTRVFKFAVETVSRCIAQVLAHTGTAQEDVRWFVLHQANARIIDLAARRCGIGADRLYVNLSQYGNTSAASIPMALSEMQEKGLLYSGDRIVLVGFGGGLTWGGALLDMA